ncbi:hypothetical protein BISA_0852 [Bifidobacterium saguini DSM 23967]|uniref:PhnA protein n=2 Tax=Bifidobacterium saguini TaxID=762210 RepID=A0A087DAA2_9BIFI|nr:hypothetical protein [Bifidobacterium saguini]KFI92452.1 hypothetical protein BISA_0852 [Bifidobacterium saguini DSM 23967]QTB90823.1 hypothetical protein BSD967_11150 [Bifidobacterium saguini]QTB90885.1 hypothetical protein BSD967_11485 [Bifidobacterium saguini]
MDKTSININRFEQDLRSLKDGWPVLDLIANRQAMIGVRMGGSHGVKSVAPTPLNMGAWQLEQDIDVFARKLVRFMGLHAHHGMNTPALLQGGILNLPRIGQLVGDEWTRQELSIYAHTLAERLDYLLDPPEDTRMVGWCPACSHELRADEQELAGGYIECPHCHAAHKIKTIHELDMLRLRLSGVKGTPTQLHRLLEPWGIDIKAATIRQWAKRGIIQPVEHDGNAPVYLIWDVWQAHTRFDGYDRARRRHQSAKKR